MIKEKIITKEDTNVNGKIVSVENYLTEDYSNLFWRIKVNGAVMYDKLKNKPNIAKYKYLT